MQEYFCRVFPLLNKLISANEITASEKYPDPYNIITYPVCIRNGIFYLVQEGHYKIYM